MTTPNVRMGTITLIRDAQGAARAVRVPVVRLVVLKGPDKSQKKKASATRLLIGSGDGADFRLTDRTVSAVHCEIIADASGVLVRDLGAKNGVILGGRRVREAWLNPKEELELGDTLLRFEILDEVEEHLLEGPKALERLRGSSVLMRQLYEVLIKAASVDLPVLISGETGTGKELAAEALVAQSSRRNRPLVVVDCAGLAPNLAESELFGHEKGAFTGANRRGIGAFERAQDGTLFFDEIGDLPLELQPKLLGVLERHRLQRIGGDEVVEVNARIISATHRDLEREVNAGRFRADLFYRLSTIRVMMPPLRDHREDIPELVAHFLDELPEAASLSPSMLKHIYEREYPGNVRELRNTVERAALGLHLPATSDSPALPPWSLNLDVPYRIQKERLTTNFERAYITRLLKECQGNVSQASRRSGINRVHLHALVRKLKP